MSDWTDDDIATVAAFLGITPAQVRAVLMLDRWRRGEER